MASLSSFSYQRALTIDTTSSGANLSSSLSTFPVCVFVNSTSWTDDAVRGRFFSASNTNGKRVQFYDAGGTSLAYEVDTYDGSGQSAVYWVGVPTIGANTTTTITVGYGNDPNGSNQDAATSVWDSNYVAVYHLNNALTDSTGNANTLTAGGSATSYETGIGGVANGAFRGTGSGYAARSTAVGITGPSAATVSGWVKINSLLTQRGYFGIGNNSIGQRIAIWQEVKTGAWLGEFRGWGRSFYQTPAAGAWTHGVVSAASSATETTVNNYGNGVTQNDGAVSAGTFSLATTPSIALLTSPTVTSGESPDATLDEIRFSKTVRSADWSKAEYFSFTPSTDASAYTRGTASPNGWTNPGNATADDGVYATAVPAAGATVSGLWDFASLSIPTTATIIGIIAVVGWYQTGSSLTMGVQGYKSGVAQGSKSTLVPGTTKSYFSADLTSAFALTDLNTAGTCQVYVDATRSGGGSTANLDFVQLVVTYSIPSSYPGSRWITLGSEIGPSRPKQLKVITQSVARAASW